MKKVLLLAFFALSLCIFLLSPYLKNYGELENFFLGKKKLFFSLLDIQGSIYRFPSSLEAKTAFLVFLPDGVEDLKKGFREVLNIEKKLRSQKDLELLLISRMDSDTMRALKRATQYRGKILLDPANSVWGRFQDQSTTLNYRDWRMSLVSKEGEVLWIGESEKPFLP